MKKILLVFLLLPTILKAQHIEWDSVYAKSIRPGLGIPLLMPAIEYNPDFIIEEQFHPRQRQMYYPISSDSVYRKIFYRHIYTVDSIKKYQERGVDSFTLTHIKKYQLAAIPLIDFDAYNLLVYAACAQCLANCKHNKVDESCHKNACTYKYTWFKYLKPKKLQWD